MDWTTVTTYVIPIILAVFTGGFAVAIVNYLANKGKNNAEAKNISITGELTLGEGWQKYAASIKKDYDEIREQIRQMNEKYNELDEAHKDLVSKYQKLEKENEMLRYENATILAGRADREQQIKTLTEDLQKLRDELARYQQSKDIKLEAAKTEIHQTVESTLEDVKNNP